MKKFMNPQRKKCNVLKINCCIGRIYKLLTLSKLYNANLWNWKVKNLEGKVLGIPTNLTHFPLQEIYLHKMCHFQKENFKLTCAKKFGREYIKEEEKKKIKKEKLRGIQRPRQYIR